jgi:hypothetical protein
VSYRYVYPKRANLDQLAYFFEYEFERRLPDNCYERVQIEIGRWQKAWRSATMPELTYQSSPEFVQIEDRRRCGELTTYSLTGPLAALYTACSEGPRGISSVRECSPAWSESKCEGALAELCRQGLMMRDGGLYLSLAIPTKLGSS